jgi:hypothetical protein
MAQKFLTNNAGTLTEVEAETSSAGAGDAGKLIGLDASGRFDQSVMPVGVAADTIAVIASEALAAGDFVNIWNATTAAARKADASVAGKEAHGFVLAAVLSSGTATVYFVGTNTQVTAAVPGVVFLSATAPGTTTAIAPAASGNVVQRIGVATSATSINFTPFLPVVLA